MRRKWSRRFLIVFGGMALLWIGNFFLSDYLVSREDARVPRDPETGVMVGAEARELGPADASGAVLFVHGYIGAGNNFADVPEQVAKHGWRVRVMRLPGHGTSPREVENVTAAELLKAVQSELAGLRKDCKKVVLVGHSMGGTLCTLAAAEEPVDALILAAPYFAVTYHWYYGLRPETWARAAARLARWGYKGKLFVQVNRKEAKDDIVSYTWAPTRTMLTLSELGAQAQDPETLKLVTCPVLLLHGRGDVAASPQAAEKAFEAMGSTNKQAVWLERSNHHVFWDYDAKEVAEEVLAFLDSIAANNSS
ncbi:MAG: alpha/beta fold hydrolase [Candidatus Hydrogenedentes bacterium]|nr:alpha/beta fold hydrolase [Candidatus Hydrogenedentota bacterium]